MILIICATGRGASDFDCPSQCNIIASVKRHLLSLNRHVNLDSISLLQLLIFYEEHVAPLVATIHEKSHCVFCHLFDSASEFYRERFLPAVTLAWARISQWCQRTYKDAMVVFEAKVLPTLIIIR